MGQAKEEDAAYSRLPLRSGVGKYPLVTWSTGAREGLVFEWAERFRSYIGNMEARPGYWRDGMEWLDVGSHTA